MNEQEFLELKKIASKLGKQVEDAMNEARSMGFEGNDWYYSGDKLGWQALTGDPDFERDAEWERHELEPIRKAMRRNRS